MQTITQSAKANRTPAASHIFEMYEEEVSWPFEYLVDCYLSHIKRLGRCSSKTESILIHRIRPYWQMHMISEVTAQNTAGWLDDLANDGLAPAKIEKIRETFSRAFEFGCARGIPGAETNPVHNVTGRYVVCRTGGDA